MLYRNLDRFLRDERGGYTIWSLVWFSLYVAMGGLAVDVTDAYRNQTLLQSTADASALAAVWSLPDQADGIAQAVTYSTDNMAPGVNGNVLKADEVIFGSWEPTTRIFTAGGTNPNAARVIARRDAANANPVATNFLRIMGLQQWNIRVEAIAMKGIDPCFTNGIIAGSKLSVTPHAHFIDEICLIGVEQFSFRKNDTTFEEGVYVGAGCKETERQCIGPGNQVYDNPDFALAFGMDYATGTGGNYEDPTKPADALKVATYIAAVRDLPNHLSFDSFVLKHSTATIDFSGYDYLYPDSGTPGSYIGAALPATLVPYTIYELTTCPQSGYVLPETVYEHVAIIADCPISFATDGDYTFKNSLIASTYSANGRMAIKGTANINFGVSGCSDGNEMYSLGNINIASGGDFANLRILADGDVHFAAQSNSPNGTYIQATGDVELASGSMSGTGQGSIYGYCPLGSTRGAHVVTVALVQ